MTRQHLRFVPSGIWRFLKNALTPVLLTFCLTAGALMCLVTAFSLNVETTRLLLTILGLSLFWLLIPLVPKSWRIVHILLVVAALLVLYINVNGIIASLQTVYTALRGIYVSAYGWGLPLWAPEIGTDGTLALSLVAVPLTLITVRSVYKARSVLFPLLLDAVPVFLCFVVIDTPPAAFWRNLFLVALGATLLSQVARRLGTGGAKLTWISAPVVLALILVVQWLLPSADYRRSDFGQTMLSTLLDWTSQVATIDVDTVFGDLDIHVPVNQAENLDIGPRNNSDRTIIEVRSQKSGSLYLRGMTYSIYTGNAWTFLDEKDYDDDMDTSLGLVVEETDQVASLSIRTRYAEPTIYTPYYLSALPGVGEAWVDACVENNNKLREYALVYYSQLAVMPAWYRVQYNSASRTGTVHSWGGFTGGFSDGQTGTDLTTSRLFNAYDNFVYEYYTDLPPETRTAALALMDDLGLNPVQLQSMNATDAVGYVTAAVRDCAEYDLNTPRMPAGSDFAIWFLSESDTGYCVHFASAATVLLRSLDIPARYVTGYLVDTQAGKWVSVSAQNAHAWTEYYVPGLGWLPVEATPGNAAITNGPAEETEPATEPTQETSPEMTRPDQPTDPGQETIPEQTDSATVPQEQDPGTIGGGTAPGGKAWWKSIHIPGWVWWSAGLLALFFLQRPARAELRQRRLVRMKPKPRFLQQWRRNCRLADLLKEPICHEDLAEKARFSAHDPSEEEETTLNDWTGHLLTVTRAKPWYIRFLVRWILVWI